MLLNNHSEIVNFIWSIADLIRDTFKRGRYQDVMRKTLKPEDAQLANEAIQAIEKRNH